MSEYQDTGMPQGTEDIAPRPGQAVIVGKFHNYRGDQSAKVTKPDISTPFPQYNLMKPKWDIISTVIDGTEAMRNANEKYLPKHEYESVKAYNNRLSRSTLKNYTLRTLETLASKAFREDPKPVDAMPDNIKKLWDDIDGEGTALSIFARRLFTIGIQKGFAFIFVDFPNTSSAPIVGVERTLKDDIDQKVRPFWKLIDPEDVIYLRTEKIDGKIIIAEARIKDLRVETGQFVDNFIEQITVYKPGSFEVFEYLQKGKSKQKEWHSVNSGSMSLNYVPIVPFYTSKEGLCYSKPPLEDLAYINVEHYQSSADQRNALTVARFPILAASGTSNDNSDNIVIGPNKFLSVSDPQARIYYVEHQGYALAAGRADLEDLEDQMASYGAEFLRKRPGSSSATGRALDSMEAISPLMAWGLDFKDALELALYYTADWMGQGNEPSDNLRVVYKVEADISIGESKELELLDKARNRLDISRNAYLGEFKRRNILSPEYDRDKDKLFIDAEKAEIQAVEDRKAASQILKQDRSSDTVTSKRGPNRDKGEPPVTTV